MTEHLYNLLSGYNLFDIAVQISQCTLLGSVITGTAHGNAASCFDHYRPHNHGNKCQPYIHVQHDRQCTDHTDGSGDQLDHRIVQQFTDHIYIIGKTAHDVTGAVGIKITDRHFLQMIKQILTDPDQRPLGYSDHNSLLGIVCYYANTIYHKHDQYAPQQPQSTGSNKICSFTGGCFHYLVCTVCKIIYDGRQQVRACQSRATKDNDTYKCRNHKPLVSSQVS